ncbi:hypothetical protein BEWA_002870 [Theileria equi strain WA]|uniref:Uncharacterized protein n=1 Tax=Theileria equi strain WA TaxID=1537102 RepID=L0AZA7_THEEQ|nr:hypothetical protein BEWA_002870 [Theileria equi strain WA]AFZ80880.1 hypothetical protein BEWA_002870 [Theileria equi strain WA]|eukprot:XP_004830546.1 hypothetical protein BEWA_002870 [Theileria equi strain WA]
MPRPEKQFLNTGLADECTGGNKCTRNCQCGNCNPRGVGACKPNLCTSTNCQCCKDNDGGAISSFNTFTSQFLMIILAFTGDGYLKTYSKYEHDRSKWPTKDCGFFKSLGYWTWNGMKVACKSVKSSFTTNVRCKVLGKSEALLIVYEDTPPEDDDPFFDLPFIKKKEEVECTPYPFVPPY